MIDWLRRGPRQAATVELNGTSLPIVIRRLAQARRMTLRLAPDGSEALVSMPRWGRSEDAIAFARLRAPWLSRQLAAMPQPEAVAAGGTIAYRGEPLLIVHCANARRRPELETGVIRLGGAIETLAPRLQRWLEGEARRLIARDLSDYCARADQPVSKLALSRARRRWGSCASHGGVRINWRLVMAPDTVRRSVVAHEVAHLVHFDHSPQFHALLATLYEGDLDAANRWLRREGPSLYGPFG
ncbi:MAG: YgjP-like metallopeptidase domain-containing protein [Novosphingobium sp.]